MANFEGYTHEQLAQLLAGADPEQLTTRADVLLAMATALNGADKQIFLRMSQVEWQGEGAEAFRAWGRHLVQESVALADYTRTIGNAMQDAGQALTEARAAMPPVPERPVPLTDEALPTLAEEMERQEAIRVLERLSGSYRAAADDMTAAQELEPQFRPFDGSRFINERNQPGGSEAYEQAGPEALGGQRLSTETASVTGERRGAASFPTVSAQTQSPAAHYEWPTGEALPLPAFTESSVGTSLDSIGPVAERLLPVVEPAPPAGEARSVGGGGAVAPDRMPPPSSVGPLQRAVLPSTPQPSLAGRSPAGGGGPGYGVTTRPPLAPAPEGHVPGRPGGGDGGQGPVAGRPPLSNGAGPSGDPAARGPHVPNGIIGGTARPPQSAGRGLPPSTAVGGGTSFAYRNPTTGLVQGPGGVPVMKRSGEPGSPPTPLPSRDGRYLGGRSTRPRRRERKESSDRRSEVQSKDG